MLVMIKYKYFNVEVEMNDEIGIHKGNIKAI